MEDLNERMVLRTENLVKKYRQRTVVNHVSIDVTQGEIVGLLGPNGAGKTTTFYMTVGLVTPNEGEIFLNDLNITKFPSKKVITSAINLYIERLRKPTHVVFCLDYSGSMYGDGETQLKSAMEYILTYENLKLFLRSLTNNRN